LTRLKAAIRYTTPEATVQTLFWALREGSSNAFQSYLEGFTPELRSQLEQQAKNRGANAFAELGVHETGGMSGFRVLKRVMLAEEAVKIQIQSGGTNGPVQSIELKKNDAEWKCAGVGK
jgi:hypothetical protein